MSYGISGIVDDIGDITDSFLRTAGGTANAAPAGDAPPMEGSIGLPINEGPNWLGSAMQTGLEAFRVREARRAMQRRPLTPGETQIFTRQNNLAALSPMGSPMGLAAIAVIAFLLLRR